MASAVNGSGASGGTTPSELAAMLRRSAEIVERRDFHPLLYQTMKALTAYAGEYAHGGSASKSVTSQSSSTPRQKEESEEKKQSVFYDVPDSLLDSSGNKQPQTAAGHNSRSSGGGTAGAVQKMGAPGGQFSSAADSAAGKSSQDKHNKGGFTKGLKGIKKGFEKLGADLIGDHQNSKDSDDDAPFDEQAWCDKCFTRGCACKSRKHVDSSKKDMERTKDTFTDQPESPTRLNNDPDKKSKPCFQRPINPNSNLIANGWIDQQRRSKMRVVWKNVLASLVEGRRPGEETTLWIQRQVVDPQTGKITELEALHQIPMKWLEDVNYVDIYGDYRFTLKVYNFAEEFYFRTRDEPSAQSWVITLRSARDASLENIGRKGDADNKWMRKESPPKEMGLDSLEGTEKGPLRKSSSSIDPPTAQADNDNSEQNMRTPVPPQPQPNSGRMKIAELRAIAHGAGYNTRGMERKDLEKIAAGVSGTVPAAPAVTEGTPDTLRQSKQQEAIMRDAEKQQREKREQREREREEQERAEILRREQHAERERMAAEQRRQQEDAQRQRQIEEIKRRQEEERLKRMAEIQAAEAKRKHDEENMRREQQRSHIPTPPASTHIPTPPSSVPFHQQQQQRSHIPSPPNSGGAPLHQQWGQPKQQQQYPQWQQQQQQQHPQQHAQYQQQAYANHQQPQPSQNPQFFNQNVPQQGGGFQQSHFQQQQPQPQYASDSKYAKQMEEKSDEEQSAANTQIKRSILINWALQPPNLNVLRPIDQLVTSIHTAMPPAFGVPSHNYFSKFTAIPHSDLVVSAAMGNHPDENKLKKSVRKVRVFLHPDKLPRDLSSEQSFMARMLWDITSDSWEEFLKHKDELDWIRS